VTGWDICGSDALMDSNKIETAAALFVQARQVGDKIWELPEDCRPQSTADTNAIIREVTRRLDSRSAAGRSPSVPPA